MLAAEAVGLLGKQSLSATQEQLPGSHSGGQQRCRRRQLLRRSGQRHLSPLPQRWEQQATDIIHYLPNSVALIQHMGTPCSCLCKCSNELSKHWQRAVK
jgi:hypothetical protein